MTQQSAPSHTAVRRATPLGLSITVAVIFGVLFSYDVFEAVGNLVGVTTLATQLSTSLNPLGWIILLLSIVLPALIFVIATRIIWKKDLVATVLVYVTGLGVSGALYLSILAVYSPGAFLV